MCVFMPADELTFLLSDPLRSLHALLGPAEDGSGDGNVFFPVISN